MTRIDAILFDKDGTLFDFRATWSNWTSALLLDLCGGEVSRATQLAHAIGYDLERREFLKDGLVVTATPDELAMAMLPYLPGAGLASLVTRINTASASVAQAEAAPLAPLMRALRARGLKLGVATNDAVAPASAHLKSVGIADLFDLVLGSDSGFGSKPDAGIALAFARHVGVPPARVMFVGDSLHDLACARAAGMPAIGVLTGIADEATLAPLAGEVLPSIAALPDWLDRNCGAAEEACAVG